MVAQNIIPNTQSKPCRVCPQLFLCPDLELIVSALNLILLRLGQTVGVTRSLLQALLQGLLICVITSLANFLLYTLFSVSQALIIHSSLNQMPDLLVYSSPACIRPLLEHGEPEGSPHLDSKYYYNTECVILLNMNSLALVNGPSMML